MSLRINATFVHEGVNYYVEADTVAELATNIGLIKGGAAAPAPSTPAPTPETGKGKKSASTDKAAASSPPADSTKADSAASAPTPASPSPAAAPAEPVVDYLKSGLPEKISGYLGDKDSGGYADRRAALVKLLGDFKVKTAKELTPAQFKDFGTKMDELAKAADEDLG